MTLFWIVFFGGLSTAVFAYWATSGAPLVVARYHRYAGQAMASGGGGPIGPTWGASWRQFIIGGVAPYVERMMPGHYLGIVRKLLRRAGMHSSADFGMTLGIQAVFAIVFALVVMPFHLLAAIPAALVGLAIPLALVAMRGSKRQASIDAMLPDTLDLVMASVEAGLALDSAVAMITKRNSPSCRAINEEFGRYLQEIQVGVARGVALRNLADRNDSDDLRHVVTALIQGDMLGVGVAQILRAQAAYLRVRRRQRAEEKAMKAPLKILFPLLLGIFPSIFVIVLGPAMLRIMDAFAKQV